MHAMFVLLPNIPFPLTVNFQKLLHALAGKQTKLLLSAAEEAAEAPPEGQPE